MTRRNAVLSFCVGLAGMFGFHRAAEGNTAISFDSDVKGEIVRIACDGRIFWLGREVETDDQFRAAMLDVRGTCGGA